MNVIAYVSINSNKLLSYALYNSKNNSSLGEIKYDNCWKKYCYYPINYLKFDEVCLRDIASFLQSLNNELKNTNGKL